MSVRPGRNEPCPCGSGKKYKKCCVDVVRPAEGDARFERARRIHVLDQRLVERILAFGKTFDGWNPREHFAIDLEKEPHAAAFFVTWAAYELRDEDGMSMADLFVEEEADSLSDEQHDWLDAQADTYLSAWEVVALEPGSLVGIRDLFTGEERTVLERSASASLAAREVVLARVVDFEGMSLFCGLHPRGLGPREGESFAKAIRQAFPPKGSKRIWADRLREPGAANLLLGCWEKVLELFAAAPAPRLCNTDGEELRLIEDTYRFTPGTTRAELVAELLRLPDAFDDQDEDAEDGDLQIVFRRDNPPGSQLENTLLGALKVHDDTLVLETNSRERAVRFRGEVERACGGRITHAGSKERDGSELLREARARGPEVRQPWASREAPPPEARAAVRGMKERAYERWLDEAIPALKGKTPRQVAASRSSTARRELDLLLREIERGESTVHPDERFDVGILRAKLGISPARSEAVT